MNIPGWICDPEGIKKYGNKVGSLHTYGLNTTEERDVSLWKALLKCKPTWKRGNQAIGDCEGFGNELCATMALAIQSELGVSEWIEEAATESIYGGGRVEIFGKKSAGYQDGATGWGCAQWLMNYGVLLRIDYSKETGNPEHDLRVYSGDKSKSWGNFGCGGANDKGKLDAVAKSHPIKGTAQVQSIQELISALSNGYPCAISSNVGYGNMVRNSEGIVRRSGQWGHCMMFGGLRWVNHKPLFRLFQSWGVSSSGDDPGIEDKAISNTSWWITESDAAYMIQTGECWAFADVEGFPPRKLDFLTAAKTWG